LDGVTVFLTHSVLAESIEIGRVIEGQSASCQTCDSYVRE